MGDTLEIGKTGYGFYEKLGMRKPNDVVVLNKAEWTDFTVG